MPDELSDLRLEREIEAARMEFDSWVGKDRLKAASALARMTDLVSRRSDAQIDRMERVRRLK